MPSRGISGILRCTVVIRASQSNFRGQAHGFLEDRTASRAGVATRFQMVQSVLYYGRSIATSAAIVVLEPLTNPGMSIS
jgi:hypothetical protein